MSGLESIGLVTALRIAEFENRFGRRRMERIDVFPWNLRSCDGEA